MKLSSTKANIVTNLGDSNSTNHIKVRDFLPQIFTLKPAYYLLCDIWAVLVTHSQAQKCLQISHKPFL